ncbi:MAG TPA: L-rhamnose isomerase [bacterium]|nr:L-rhamnose isomerase [bacterium]HPG44775.1 L-rhamnose isomerase [bacterium]HPM99053.1 L-rhamnose isomerase [bacterium]
MNEKQISLGVQLLEQEFGAKRVRQAIDAVQKFRVEVPSWVFGNFGAGRFGDYTPSGVARNIFEKLQDAAMIHQLTGATPNVAMHILWDFTEDGWNPSWKMVEKVDLATRELGLAIGAINPTYFLKGSHRNSYSADEKETVDRYIDQTVVSAEIAKKYGNNLVTLWFPDGSSYPGQVQLSRVYRNMKDSLHRTMQQIDPKVKVLIEYKLFEPGTYHTVISDWGTSYMLTQDLGKNAGVLVDLGHHPHATNIEQIVMRLVVEGVPAGFHFNTRYAADDDHSVEPNPEMARIFYELVLGDVVTNSKADKNWAYMIDQCSGREHRMHAILHSIDSLQVALARAMLVDTPALQKLQDRDELILANRLFNNAMILADVRPLVAAARLDKNLPADPFAAYDASGYRQKTDSERV